MPPEKSFDPVSVSGEEEKSVSMKIYSQRPPMLSTDTPYGLYKDYDYRVNLRKRAINFITIPQTALEIFYKIRSEVGTLNPTRAGIEAGGVMNFVSNYITIAYGSEGTVDPPERTEAPLRMAYSP